MLAYRDIRRTTLILPEALDATLRQEAIAEPVHPAD